jgi:hypothetical protein
MLLGRPAMMRVCASEPGDVVELTRDQMHALIQTDAEMSEVLMKALHPPTDSPRIARAWRAGTRESRTTSDSRRGFPTRSADTVSADAAAT